MTDSSPQSRETVNFGSPVAETWRSRIVGLTYEDPASLEPHPLNPKSHPPEQRAALRQVLGELGWIACVLLNDRTGRIVDGHERRDEALEKGEPTVPVLHIDLDDAEELLALATFDPIGQLAQIEADAGDQLLDAVGENRPQLVEFLAGLRPPGPPDEFPAFDENVADGLVLRARWTLQFPPEAAADVRAGLESLRGDLPDLAWDEGAQRQSAP